MSETGAIKFHCEHQAVPLSSFEAFAELNDCRQQLLQRGLIGIDASGIGFGNLSARDGLTSDFHITGSGTGGMTKLTLEHYAKVTSWDFERNWLRCAGGTIASSESLTHAAVYAADRSAGAVIHCHSADLWGSLLGAAPATAAEVEYGTPAMAREVQRLFQITTVQTEKIFVMAGHENGVIAFGETPYEALTILLAELSRVSS